MKNIFFVLIFLTKFTWGNSTISPQTFQINIKPILSSIIQDYYQMLSLFKGYPPEIISIVKLFNNLEDEKKSLENICSQKNPNDCFTLLAKIKNQINEIETLSLGLLGNIELENSLYFNSIIGIRQVTELHLGLMELKYKLSQISFLQYTKIKNQKSPYRLMKMIDELQLKSSLCLIDFVPRQYKEEIKTFYFDFIFPLERQLKRDSNVIFFNQRLNALNFSLNLLNQNLTKRNKKTPEGWAPYLLTIHNKWNSIFRYYK
jgi:hypothetical protein